MKFKVGEMYIVSSMGDHYILAIQSASHVKVKAKVISTDTNIVIDKLNQKYAEFHPDSAFACWCKRYHPDIR